MKTRVITGLTILGGAGLLFAFGDLLIPQENVIFEAESRPQDFAALVTSLPYKIWSFRGFLGVLMEMVGSVALYIWLAKTRVEKLAFWGLIFTLTHQILGAAVFAVAHFLFPAIGDEILKGNTAIVHLTSMASDLGVLFGVSLISTLLGTAIMATAIFKSNLLPRWSGWLAFLGFLMIPLPGVIVQFVANALWAGAYFWMAYHVKKDKVVEEVEVPQLVFQ